MSARDDAAREAPFGGPYADPSGTPERRLRAVLGEARERALLGSPPITDQIRHSEAFGSLLTSEPVAGPVLDLGSGGGLPGLVLAVCHPELEFVLLDSTLKRTRYLSWAVEQLDLADSVHVVTVRAEDAGHEYGFRGRFAAVLSRSFGRPAVAAECAAPFLLVGGRLIVSEPPVEPCGDGRWPEAGCGLVGLRPERSVSDPFHFVVLRQTIECGERFARRAGIPAKRPLF